MCGHIAGIKEKGREFTGHKFVLESNIQYNVIHQRLLVKGIKWMKSETLYFYNIDGRELSGQILDEGTS